MAINSYSTYATYLGNVGAFKQLQTSLATLTQQLNSGKKSTDITEYGVEGTRLLDLRAEVKKREGYIDTIKSAETDVKAYDKVMSRMEALAQNMNSAFTSPLSDPPTTQQHKITIDGDIGDVGDIYKIVVDGKLFSYVTTGLEGSLDEIAGNLANQINNAQPALRAKATVSSSQITITGTEPGPLFSASASVEDVAGGTANTISIELTRAGKISPIVGQIDAAIKELQSLMNEQINERYLFGGSTANELAPVVDLSRLPDPTGSKNAAAAKTTQQLAAGTIVQRTRVTTDYLGALQSETFTVNATNFTFNGPLTPQQLALQAATAIGAAFPGVIAVSDVDANGFTLTSATPGTAFTASVTGTDPTPSTLTVVQPNVPIGAAQRDVITLSGPIGIIGETYSVTITDPPAHAAPVTVSYRTTGDEPDMDTIVNNLIAKINGYQPAFTVTPANLGNGQLQLSRATAFTSSAAVQDTATVTTTQRTVVPVAKEDEVHFAGPFGDIGDVYTLNFTSPVAGPFQVTTTATDDEVSVASKFQAAINAAGFGVNASIRDGRLYLTSATPGTPFTYTAVLTTDVGQVSQAPAISNKVANIVAGPLPQIDTVQLSGPVGRKGDVYELTVNGRTVRYTTTGAEADMDAIAINITALVNAQTPPMPATAVAGATGSGKILLTAAVVGVELHTAAKVVKPVTVSDPTPTEYNVHQEPQDAQRSWTRSDIAIADELNIQYGFTANEAAFQRLQLALRTAQSAVRSPDTYFEKMETARTLSRDALVGIRALHADNTVHDALMSATTLSHQTTINLNTDSTDQIETADPNEVAAKLQSAQVQLQAVFSVVSSSTRLSLVNFLT